MSMRDYEAVYALWGASEGVGLGEGDTKNRIAGYLKRNPGLSFVALKDRKIVGAVISGHDGRRGWIYHLAVVKEHREKGIAKALAEKCYQGLKKAGMRKCSIFVFAGNKQGKKFWRKHGWEKWDDIDVMHKEL